MSIRKRSRLDVILDMLRLADENPTRKTEFMYKVNMSYQSLKAYLDFLLDTRMIEPVFVGTEKHYRITRKGKMVKENMIDLLKVMEARTFRKVLEET